VGSDFNYIIFEYMWLQTEFLALEKSVDEMIKYYMKYLTQRGLNYDKKIIRQWIFDENVLNVRTCERLGLVDREWKVF
jgi:hypothetical protein